MDRNPEDAKTDVAPERKHNLCAGDDFAKNAAEVAALLLDILEPSCGPLSNFVNVIPTPEDEDDPAFSPFTRDGKTLVSRLEMVAAGQVEQHHLLQTLKYIGDEAENNLGDGTTTALYVFAYAMHKFFSLDATERAALRSVPYQKFFDECSQYKGFVDDLIEERKLTPEVLAEQWGCPIEEAENFLVYCQAHTATHGDHMLANAVKDYYRAIHMEQAVEPQFIIAGRQQSRVNARTIFVDHDYEVEGTGITWTTMNTFDQKGYDLPEGGRIFVCPSDVLNFDSSSWKEFALFLQSLTIPEDGELEPRPAAVICRSIPPGLINVIHDNFATHKIKNIVVLTAGKAEAMATGVDTFDLFLIATGQMDYYGTMNDLAYEFHCETGAPGFKFDANDKKLKFYNLFKENHVFHPYYRNPEFQHYNRYLESMETKAAAGKKLVDDGSRDPSVHFKLRKVRQAVQSLRFFKTPKFLVEGRRYEKIRVKPQIDDALRVVNTTLTDGVVPCGVSIAVLEPYDAKSPMLQFLIDAIREGLDIVWRIANQMPKEDPEPSMDMPFSEYERCFVRQFAGHISRHNLYFEESEGRTFTGYNIVAGKHYNFASKISLDDLKETDKVPAFQSAKLESEIVGRVFELLSLYLYTDSMLVPVR